MQGEKSLFTTGDFTNPYVEHWWNYLKDTRDTDDKEKDTYIACFSERRNVLDQYRAYGNYCIGFDAKRLITRPGFYFYKCVYDKDNIKRWILEKEKVAEWNGDSLNKGWKSGAAWRLIYDASKKFKHCAFKREREVRIISVSHHTWKSPDNPSMYAKDPPIHYRDHPKLRLPVPYVKLFIIVPDKPACPLTITSKETSKQMKERKRKEEGSAPRGLLPIREVWIGPMVHQEAAKTACEILLKDRGYGNVAVNASDIPYRGF